MSFIDLNLVPAKELPPSSQHPSLERGDCNLGAIRAPILPRIRFVPIHKELALAGKRERMLSSTKSGVFSRLYEMNLVPSKRASPQLSNRKAGPSEPRAVNCASKTASVHDNRVV